MLFPSYCLAKIDTNWPPKIHINEDGWQMSVGDSRDMDSRGSRNSKSFKNSMEFFGGALAS